MAGFTVVQRELLMGATRGQIAAQLVDFRRWPQWSPWEGLDPALVRRYGGADSGMGASYEWFGNRRAGAGRMEITAVTDRSVDIDLQFSRPFKSRSQVHFDLDSRDAGDNRQTNVVWSMRSPRTLAMRILGLVFRLERAIGSDLEKGLASLKSQVEQA